MLDFRGKKRNENEKWVHSIKQREMHRDSVCERDQCSRLWSMRQLSLHLNMSVQIWMLMSPNVLKKNAEHIYTYTIPFFSPFFFLCFTHHTHTHTHTNNAGTAWNKQSTLGFFCSHIHGRMLEKTFIKGFNTSRVFSWKVFFWTHTRTHTQVTSMHAYSTKANIYTFYHLITLSLHLSTPTNKVLVNNQTHPSYLSWKPFQTKANVTTETSGMHLCPETQPLLSKHLLEQIQMHILIEWVILNILNHKRDLYTFWTKLNQKIPFKKTKQWPEYYN